MTTVPLTLIETGHPTICNAKKGLCVCGRWGLSPHVQLTACSPNTLWNLINMWKAAERETLGKKSTDTSSAQVWSGETTGQKKQQAGWHRGSLHYLKFLSNTPAPHPCPHIISTAFLLQLLWFQSKHSCAFFLSNCDTFIHWKVCDS